MVNDYPSGKDYVAAVQHPRIVFSAPRLQAAVFVTGMYGIPAYASGNAAVVFKAAIGGTDRALRFFTRPDVSSRERYNILGSHFDQHHLADCVPAANWHDDAIAVNGKAWPLLEMEWVEGRRLDIYVDDLVCNANAAALSRLALAWRSLAERLPQADFAHGDLQAGNILVDNSGRLQLVDFDGCWTPLLAGKSAPNETGHPDYQHPQREWGRWMDTFPSLVIYASLLAVSKDPTLWAEFYTGENLLFKADDYVTVSQTDVWRRLATIGDSEVDHVSRILRQCCALARPPTADLHAVLSGTSTNVGRGTHSGDKTYHTWWNRTATAETRPPAIPDSSELPAASTANAPRVAQPLPAPPPKSHQSQTASTSTTRANHQGSSSWDMGSSTTTRRLGTRPSVGKSKPERASSRQNPNLYSSSKPLPPIVPESIPTVPGPRRRWPTTWPRPRILTALGAVVLVVALLGLGLVAVLGRGGGTVTFSAPGIPYTLDVPASWTARTHEAGASSVTVLSSSDLRALFADDPTGMKDAADGARRDPDGVVGLAIYHQPRLRAATPADRLRSAEALLPGREARLSGRAVEPVGDVEGQVMNGVLPLSPSFSLEVRVLALATDPEQVLVFFAPHSRFEESEETFNHVADSLRRSG